MIIENIEALNKKFGIKFAVNKLTPDLKKEYLEFRINFLEEELDELKKAFQEEKGEDVVDALIDLVVVALGTLDSFDVDIDKAWFRVHFANMKKELGVNKSRKNIFNLPDLIKPKSWKEPFHGDNIGTIKEIYNAGD
tara:strand:+ start:192 stop:602 length:411 start_codon:yes stop_codon:yes gene_type:complete